MARSRHDEKFRYHLQELRGLLSEAQRVVIQQPAKADTTALKKALVSVLIAASSALAWYLQSLATRPHAPPAVSSEPK